jgi:spore germination protein PE
MQNRVSIVRQISINSNVLSSIVRIGDSVTIQPRSKVLAVQREAPLFLGDEGELDPFPIFSVQLPKVPIPTDIHTSFDNKNSLIGVNSIRIIGLSTAAVLQVGSSQRIDSEARVKHIRQLTRKI